MFQYFAHKAKPNHYTIDNIYFDTFLNQKTFETLVTKVSQAPMPEEQYDMGKHVDAQMLCSCMQRALHSTEYSKYPVANKGCRYDSG